VTPTPRVAAALAALSISFLVVPVELPLFAALALVAATAVDAWWARRVPVVRRGAATTLARGVPSPFSLRTDEPGMIRRRQPLPPEVRLEAASEAEGELDGERVARRRGLHLLPQAVARRRGPLGLAAWTHRVEAPAEVIVYPDLPAARRLASLVRTGRFRDEGLRRRGPLGLGTEFESVRDYSPDDDIRQVNWRATARLGRPMSNQYRVERDRDVLCVIDCGRLMAAPFADRRGKRSTPPSRCSGADVLGDCGAIAFAGGILRSLPPRRGAP
jgi:uncharacterized protein (DUF58 family)